MGELFRHDAEQFPAVDVSVIASNAASDLKGREADIAIRLFEPTQPDLIARRVGELVAHLYATPAYLRSIGNPSRLSDLQLRVEHCHATIPFVLDGQVLEDNLHWCGKDRAWLERTAQANTLLPQEILLLVGNETEDYFLLKKERRATVHEGRK